MMEDRLLRGVGMGRGGDGRSWILLPLLPLLLLPLRLLGWKGGLRRVILDL